MMYQSIRNFGYFHNVNLDFGNFVPCLCNRMVQNAQMKELNKCNKYCKSYQNFVKANQYPLKILQERKACQKRLLPFATRTVSISGPNEGRMEITLKSSTITMAMSETTTYQFVRFGDIEQRHWRKLKPRQRVDRFLSWRHLQIAGQKAYGDDLWESQPKALWMLRKGQFWQSRICSSTRIWSQWIATVGPDLQIQGLQVINSDQVNNLARATLEAKASALNYPRPLVATQSQEDFCSVEREDWPTWKYTADSGLGFVGSLSHFQIQTSDR